MAEILMKPAGGRAGDTELAFGRYGPVEAGTVKGSPRDPQRHGRLPE
jgi:hypothetical protein